MNEELQGVDESSLESVTDSPSVYGLSQADTSPAPSPKHKLPKYVLPALILIIVVLAVVVALFMFRKPAKQVTPTPIVINTQSLDNGTLNKLSTLEGGNPTKQQLTISPDTLFKNGVEIQGPVKTNGNLDVGGNLTVHGTSTLQGAVGINNNLAVRGALSVGGALSAASLSVGALNVTTVNASGNINFGGHMVPSGTTPSAKASVAASGGNVTISGNDTAGTITINMGSGGLLAGELAIITFHAAFATTPKVQLTPITGSASALDYYATRSTSLFTINTSNNPTNGAQYVFDYLVTQ